MVIDSDSETNPDHPGKVNEEELPHALVGVVEDGPEQPVADEQDDDSKEEVVNADDNEEKPVVNENQNTEAQDVAGKDDQEEESSGFSVTDIIKGAPEEELIEAIEERRESFRNEPVAEVFINSSDKSENGAFVDVNEKNVLEMSKIGDISSKLPREELEGRLVASTTNSMHEPSPERTKRLPTVSPEATNDHETGSVLKSVICALCICLGSFVLGTVIGYPSPAVPDINDHVNPFHVSDEQSSWIGSIVPLGALFGGLIGGVISDKLGRKLALMCTAVSFAIGWVLIVSSPSFGCMVAGRAVSGLSIGVVSVACPVYLGEISPPSIRGLLGSCHQMAVCLGILFTYGFGAFLSWDWLGISCLVWVVFLIVAVFFIPDSPRWLLSVKQKEAAEDSLKWLRGKDFNVQKEIDSLEVAIKESEDKASLKEFLQPELYKPLLISMGLMMFQQLSGINVIMFYTVDIFQNAHVDMDPSVETIIVGAVGVVGTLVSVFISDSAGRRILLVISGAAMTITIAGMGAYFYVLDHDYATATSKSMSWLPITCLVIFNFGFNVAFGPLPWVMMSELFPLRAKAIASSISSASNWLFAFLLTKFWVNMTAGMTVAGGYWFCAAFCLLSIPFILLFVPETKGRTVEEIAASFK